MDRTSASRKYYLKHKQAILAKHKAYNAKSRDKINAWARGYRRQNPELMRSIEKRYRLNNVETVRRIRRASGSRHKAKKMNLRHPNRDDAKINALYRLAALKRMEVDHIIPLSSGGWHHELNLQLLPKAINGLKNRNPFWEMKGYKSWKDVPKFLWPKKLISSYRTRLEHPSMVHDRK